MLITQGEVATAEELIAELDRELAGRTSELERQEVTFAAGCLRDYTDLCVHRQPGGGSRWEATDVELIGRFGSAVAYARGVVDWLHQGGIGLIIGAMVAGDRLPIR